MSARPCLCNAKTGEVLRVLRHDRERSLGSADQHAERYVWRRSAGELSAVVVQLDPTLAVCRRACLQKVRKQEQAALGPADVENHPSVRRRPRHHLLFREGYPNVLPHIENELRLSYPFWVYRPPDGSFD